jgi:predicted Ser/Thr protein kinase
MEDFLDKKNIKELKLICDKLELKSDSTSSKAQIKKDIISFLNKDENSYKKIYQAYEQIGNVGKEGIVYIIKDQHGKEFAMKQFRKSKSSKKLETEFDLQKQASVFKVCPQVYDVNIKEKYIIMENIHIVNPKEQLTSPIKIENFDLLLKVIEKKFDGDV